MSAFFVATVTIKDPEKFQAYANAVGETFTPHGGELVLRGMLDSALTGSVAHSAVGIARFPDMAALKAWYDSAAYQALIPLRDEAADMTIAAYAVPG